MDIIPTKLSAILKEHKEISIKKTSIFFKKAPNLHQNQFLLIWNYSAYSLKTSSKIPQLSVVITCQVTW